jgi:hypothetical protein
MFNPVVDVPSATSSVQLSVAQLHQLSLVEAKMHELALAWFTRHDDLIDPSDPELIRGVRAYAKGFREGGEIPFFLSQRKWPPTR